MTLIARFTVDGERITGRPGQARIAHDEGACFEITLAS